MKGKEILSISSLTVPLLTPVTPYGETRMESVKETYYIYYNYDWKGDNSIFDKEIERLFDKAIKEGNIEKGVLETPKTSWYLFQRMPEKVWILDSTDLVSETSGMEHCAECGKLYNPWRLTKRGKLPNKKDRLCKPCYEKKYTRTCKTCGIKFFTKVGIKIHCNECQRKSKLERQKLRERKKKDEKRSD